MKNFVIGTLLLFLITISAHSQINVGLKAGLNGNNESFKDEQTKIGDLKLGYHFGVNVSYQLNNSFSFTSGLIYVNKGSNSDLYLLFFDPYEGAEYEASIIEFDGHFKKNFNYIEIPLQLSYNIWKDLQIYGGPYAAFGISGSRYDDYVISKNGNKGINVDRKETIKPVYKSIEIEIYQLENGVEDIEIYPQPFNGFDYGVNFGIGYKFEKILLSTEYSAGLGNVTPKYTNFERHIHRHRILYFSVSYLLFEK